MSRGSRTAARGRASSSIGRIRDPGEGGPEGWSRVAAHVQPRSCRWSRIGRAAIDSVDLRTQGFPRPWPLRGPLDAARQSAPPHGRARLRRPSCPRPSCSTSLSPQPGPEVSQGSPPGSPPVRVSDSAEGDACGRGDRPPAPAFRGSRPRCFTWNTGPARGNDRGNDVPILQAPAPDEVPTSAGLHPGVRTRLGQPPADIPREP